MSGEEAVDFWYYGAKSWQGTTDSCCARLQRRASYLKYTLDFESFADKRISRQNFAVLQTVSPK